MENVDGLQEPSVSLKDTLNNWANERPIWLKSQRDVRANIAKVIATDISYPPESNSVPKELINYRIYVNEGLKTAIDKLNTLPANDEGVIGTPKELKDSVTKLPFTTRIRKGADGYISEEIRPDGSVISQAVISNNGDLRLTLNFQEPRYEERKANPKIINDSKFPIATKALFLNHCASFGVITWKGK